MPRIQDLLDVDLIIEDLQATDKAGVIRELASLLKSRGKVQDEDALFDIVMQRESTTTGIGDGRRAPNPSRDTTAPSFRRMATPRRPCSSAPISIARWRDSSRASVNCSGWRMCRAPRTVRSAIRSA